MRIAFFSSNCLVDTASGAARSVRTILEMLAARGHETRSVTGTIFDAPEHETEAHMFSAAGFEETEDGVWTFDHAGLRHTALRTGALRGQDLTPEKAHDLAERAMAHLGDFAPDIVMTYGGTAAEYTVRANMTRRNVPVVFYLANPSYKDKRFFKHIDLVFTDSEATRDYYKDLHGLDSAPIGKFIHPMRRIEGERSRFVTFINPDYQKGVTLFFRIAEMMRHQLPDVTFQVVESRATLAQIERKSGLPFSLLSNIRVIGPQKDMARVYARTKVLLVPSLWHESGPRVGLEAMSLGIPVIGANHSGLRENIGDGGILFNVPQKMRDEPRLIPPPRTVLPWVAALENLLTDPEAYDRASAAATAHWEAHLSVDRIARVEDHFKALLEAS